MNNLLNWDLIYRPFPLPNSVHIVLTMFNSSMFILTHLVIFFLSSSKLFKIILKTIWLSIYCVKTTNPLKCDAANALDGNIPWFDNWKVCNIDYKPIASMQGVHGMLSPPAVQICCCEIKQRNTGNVLVSFTWTMQLTGLHLG